MTQLKNGCDTVCVVDMSKTVSHVEVKNTPLEMSYVLILHVLDWFSKV